MTTRFMPFTSLSTSRCPHVVLAICVLLAVPSIAPSQWRRLMNPLIPVSIEQALQYLSGTQTAQLSPEHISHLTAQAASKRSLLVELQSPAAPSELCSGGSMQSAIPAAPLARLRVKNQAPADPFAHWNDLEPEAWWRDSAPYSCRQEAKRTSPWQCARLVDLGGSDPLSLIRYFGNGSYLRYGHMGFYGCTELKKYPEAFRLDPPADPTYYSVGDLEIWVDIARVPRDASGWHADDGTRVGLEHAGCRLAPEFVCGSLLQKNIGRQSPHYLPCRPRICGGR